MLQYRLSGTVGNRWADSIDTAYEISLSLSDKLSLQPQSMLHFPNRWPDLR
jgi:hypothetical protein